MPETIAEKKMLAQVDREYDVFHDRSWPQRFGIWLLLLGLLVGGSTGFWLGNTRSPGPESIDVGFARDMSDHHRQAVEMAILLYDRTDDASMRVLAYDILTTQQAQIGIMSGWLDIWGEPWTSLGPKMEWMGMSVTSRMPGMATLEEMNALRAASDREAEIIFMQLMIPHHRSGVAMAAAAADGARSDAVRSLARSMAESQEVEIAYMQQLLRERGVEPAPDPPDMNMGDE